MKAAFQKARFESLAEGVPKTPRTHSMQLFESARRTGSENAVPKTHDFDSIA
jgi:hypothetical protein